MDIVEHDNVAGSVVDDDTQQFACKLASELTVIDIDLDHNLDQNKSDSSSCNRNSSSRTDSSISTGNNSSSRTGNSSGNSSGNGNSHSRVRRMDPIDRSDAGSNMSQDFSTGSDPRSGSALGSDHRAAPDSDRSLDGGLDGDPDLGPDLGPDHSPNLGHGSLQVYKSPTFSKYLSIRISEPVGSMSISPSGRDIVLGSQFGLMIVDLDRPYEPPRFLHHQTPWHVADIQWNVHPFRDEWIVSTANQRALVWNTLLPSDAAVELILHGHSRAITDINWSPFRPDLLATCSIDSFVHSWDLRAPQAPAVSFSDWSGAGATQVKWNRQNEHVVASSHGRFIHIWDTRFGARPLSSICTAPYPTMVYSIDFNRTRSQGIISSGLDQSVKFWDYSKDCSVPERTLHTRFPVWRARHAPFGWAVTVLPLRESFSVFMFDRRASGDEDAQLITSFDGHTDRVREFLFRSRGGTSLDHDDREFQLVTYSDDKHVRLWPISSDTLIKSGHDPSKPVKVRLTRRGARYRTFRTLDSATEPRHESIIRPKNSSSGLQTSHWKFQRQQPRGEFMTKAGNMPRKEISAINWMQGVKISTVKDSRYGYLIGSFADELSWLSNRLSKVHFERIDIAEKTCTVTLFSNRGDDDNRIFLRLEIHIPRRYPNAEIPEFHLQRAEDLALRKTHVRLLDDLRKIALAHLQHRLPCLTACLEYLLGDANFVDGEWKLDYNSASQRSDSSSDEIEEEEVFPVQSRPTKHPQVNSNIPIPKESASIFSAGDELICFFVLWSEGQLLQPKSVGDSYDETSSSKTAGHFSSEDVELSTPFSSSCSEDELSDSASYGTANRSNNWNSFRDPQFSRQLPLFSSAPERRNIIRRINLSADLPAKKYLAQHYRLMGPRSALCRYNADVAWEFNERLRAETWEALLMITMFDGIAPAPLVHSFSQGLDPSGRLCNILLKPIEDSLPAWILAKILNQFLREADVQMIAMIVFVFRREFAEAIAKLKHKQLPPLNLRQSLESMHNSEGSCTLEEEFHQLAAICPEDGLLSRNDSMSKDMFQEYVSDFPERQFLFQDESPMSSVTHRSGSRTPGRSYHDTNLPPSLQITILRTNSDLSTKSGQFSHRSSPFTPFSWFSSSKNDVTPDSPLKAPIDRTGIRSMVHSRSASKPSTPTRIFRIETPQPSDEIAHSNSIFKLFDIPSLWNTCESYAEMLLSWNLPVKRLELLKVGSSFEQRGNEREFKGLEPVIVCDGCGKGVRFGNRRCSHCDSAIRRAKCSICELGVRGLFTICLNCRHGGHTRCYLRWTAAVHKLCPQGCGCNCIF